LAHGQNISAKAKAYHFIGNNETTAAKTSSAGIENKAMRLSMTASIRVLAAY
jgi:hypothetical protein